MKASTDNPFFSSFDIQPDLDWQMSRSEKYCLIHLLETLQPEVSIEIGTYKGGSLQVISHFSKEVHSIDISPAPKQLLEARFPNAHFHVAQSGDILKQIFERIEQEGKQLGFVLIDGDHSKKGVRADIHHVLSYPHKHPFTILLHDSFNPQCRAGVKSVDYANYPAVSYVEIDYITGAFWHNDTYREMWGGFAMIKVNPQRKDSGVVVLESQKRLFRHTRLASIHLLKDNFLFLRPVKKALYKLLRKKDGFQKYLDFNE
jgi:hypothetical protein